MKLPRDIKAEINKLAHAAGVAHGEQVKLRLLAEIERRMNADERQDAMLAALRLNAMTEAELTACAVVLPDCLL